MENKRQQILDTALQLIQQSGFDSFSYSDLSEIVGITKASIHYYFPSKEDLGIAVLKMVGERSQLLNAIIAQRQSPTEMLSLYVKAVLISNPGEMICPVSSLQAAYNVIPEAMKAELQRLSALELDSLTAILQQGLDEGVFEFKGTAREYAALMLTSLKGALQYSRALKEDLRKSVIDVLMRQILRP